MRTIARNIFEKIATNAGGVRSDKVAVFVSEKPNKLLLKYLNNLRNTYKSMNV